MRSSLQRTHGFTLIELLIAVAIVGIIAAVAVPSYSAYVQKTRRTDATIFLVEAAGEQVRFQSENNIYADALDDLGYPDETMTTPEGLYRVSVRPDSATATAFVLEAVPVADRPQAGDADCQILTITSTGVKAPAECW